MEFQDGNDNEEPKEGFDLKDIIAFIIAIFIHLLPITLFMVFLVIIFFIITLVFK